MKRFHEYRLMFCDECFYIWEQDWYWLTEKCPRCGHTLEMTNYIPEEFSVRIDAVERPYEWRQIVSELHEYMLDTYGANVDEKYKHPLKWLKIP